MAVFLDTTHPMISFEEPDPVVQNYWHTKLTGHYIFKCLYTIHIVIFSYMPYLTLWDKISQNSAYLKADSQKNFQISQNF